MARLARVVVPGIPHHITQCGNRGLETFFSEADYRQFQGRLTYSKAIYFNDFMLNIKNNNWL
jgi:hypothetical protein